MKYLPIAFVLLTACAGYDARLARVENQQNYVVEIVKNRRMSAERCAKLEGEGMPTCRLAANERCRCQFTADDQDRENAAFAAAVAQAQKQAAEAEREKAAEE